MDENENLRVRRINRLLSELEYEVTRGVLEREIHPEMQWHKILPGGPTGTVVTEFRIRAVHDGEFPFTGSRKPNLRVVGSNKNE